MLFDIIKFNQFALDLLSQAEESEEDPSGANGTTAEFHKPRHQESIGDYLVREGYSEAFRDDYLIPMTAAVWSTSPDKCSLDFPAMTLVRFMWNHHLLTTVSARPTWMTIPGGSQQYIDAIITDIPQNCIHLGTGIESLHFEQNSQIILRRQDGQEDVYDHVILATHGDQAMDIIRETATFKESAIMSQFKTSKNSAVLHSDLSVRKITAPVRKARTDMLPADAQAFRCVVIMELHHRIFVFRRFHILCLPDLLDEPIATHPHHDLRGCTGYAQSNPSTRSRTRSRIMDL